MPKNPTDSSVTVPAEMVSFQETHYLYLVHTAFSFVSRSWDFAITLFLADMTNNNLFIIALTGLTGSIATLLLMPRLGIYLDATNRLLVIQQMLFVKLVAVSSAYLFCGFSTTTNVSVYITPLLCAVATISITVITQSIEKDWVVVLSGGDSNWLSEVNSVMTQIDLACASLAPACTGFLFSFLSRQTMSLVMLALNYSAVSMLYLFAGHLFHKWPALSVKVNHSSSDTTQFDELEKKDASDNDDIKTVTSNSPTDAGVYEAVTLFLQSGCAGAMVAYSILYFSVLTFGALMTVYLRSISVSDNIIGVARGANAISGFLGAYLFPWFKTTFGLYRSATYAIVYQCCLVVLAASSFVFLDVGLSYVSAIVLMSAVVASRAGLWLFDLCVRQLAQEAIPEHSRGAVNGLWNSLISFFNITTYLAAMAYPSSDTFWILTSFSATAVVAALVIFCATLPPRECVVGDLCCFFRSSYVSIDAEFVELESRSNKLSSITSA